MGSIALATQPEQINAADFAPNERCRAYSVVDKKEQIEIESL